MEGIELLGFGGELLDGVVGDVGHCQFILHFVDYTKGSQYI
jgi:hypothetical protein